MKNVIQQISATEFKLESRGNAFTLEKESDGRWVMWTVNAAVRAWNNGYPMPKYFGSLAEVEAKYKAWRGIGALVNA